MNVDVAREAVVEAVAAVYDVPREHLLCRTRVRASAEARMVAFSLCEELSDAGPTETGRAFGVTHKNVIHSRKRVADLASIDAAFATRLEQCIRRLGIKPEMASRVTVMAVSRLRETDQQFVRQVVAVLVNPEHRRFADSLRVGKASIRYTRGGGVEVVAP